MVAEIPQSSGASEASVDDRGIAADVATRRDGNFSKVSNFGKVQLWRRDTPKKTSPKIQEGSSN